MDYAELNGEERGWFFLRFLNKYGTFIEAFYGENKARPYMGGVTFLPRIAGEYLLRFLRENGNEVEVTVALSVMELATLYEYRVSKKA